ncbi:MAG: hypothetical protein M1831_004088 [Alyxoria varia]|nr:MAG: hypothetical protein M1831_004088 [Alyxoria varia]
MRSYTNFSALTAAAAAAALLTATTTARPQSGNTQQGGQYECSSFSGSSGCRVRVDDKLTTIPVPGYPAGKTCVYDDKYAMERADAQKKADDLANGFELERIFHNVTTAGQCRIFTDSFDPAQGRISVCAEAAETDKAKLEHNFEPADVGKQAQALLTECPDTATGKVGGKLPFAAPYENFFVFLDTTDAPGAPAAAAAPPPFPPTSE